MSVTLQRDNAVAFCNTFPSLNSLSRADHLNRQTMLKLIFKPTGFVLVDKKNKQVLIIILITAGV